LLSALTENDLCSKLTPVLGEKDEDKSEKLS